MSTLKIEKEFRLKCISVFDLDTRMFESMPVSYGLGVEYGLLDGTYVVVAFIKPVDGRCQLEIVDDRLQTYVTKENYDGFISLVKEAFRYVKICNGFEL